MAARNFSYEGITIRVETRQPSDLQWLQEFLYPWFDLSDAIADIRVEFLVDPEQFRALQALGCPGEQVRTFMMDTRVIHHPLWTLPGRPCLLFEEELNLFMHVSDRRVEIIADKQDSWSRLQLMRVVRELAMGAAQARGGRFLHASALALEGKAIIVVGKRLAGKTSLLTYLLSHLEAGLLANDRLLVLGQHGDLECRGMPTIVSIRNSAMPLFPGLQENLRQNHLTTRLTLEESRTADDSVFAKRHPEKWGLSPAQFCAATDSRPIRDAGGGVLLFPRQNRHCSGLALTEMGVEETRAALTDGLFGNIAPDKLSEVFTLPANRANNFPDPEFLHALATSLPAYQCTLGHDAYTSAEGAERIRQLL